MSSFLHLLHFSHSCQLTKQNIPASHREESSFTKDENRVCTSLKLCILRLHITVTRGFGCSSLIISETWQERRFCKYLFRTLYPFNSIILKSPLYFSEKREFRQSKPLCSYKFFLQCSLTRDIFLFLMLYECLFFSMRSVVSVQDYSA